MYWLVTRSCSAFMFNVDICTVLRFVFPAQSKPQTVFTLKLRILIISNCLQVLELLKVAWTRRLIFTVGTSSTTGEPDTVIWNEIHHKTEMMSNVSGHGYPDPNYLDNVLSELASQGVTEDCLKRDTTSQGAQGSAMWTGPSIYCRSNKTWWNGKLELCCRLDVCECGWTQLPSSVSTLRLSLEY